MTPKPTPSPRQDAGDSLPGGLERELLPFFKALAEETRLRIVGLLALGPKTVEELAEALGLRASTVSHHLARLSEVGLVSARAESYFNVYRLESQALEQGARKVLAGVRPAPAEGAEGSAFDRKVLRTFLSEEGQITQLPVQEKKKLVLLRHVVKAFEIGPRYSEKQVTQILKKFSKDHHVTLRRLLIDHKFMAREGGGGEYWRLS